MPRIRIHDNPRRALKTLEKREMAFILNDAIREDTPELMLNPLRYCSRYSGDHSAHQLPFSVRIQEILLPIIYIIHKFANVQQTAKCSPFLF